MNDLAKIIITTFTICMIIKTYFENRIIPIKQGFQHRYTSLSSIMNKIDRKSFLQNESKIFSLDSTGLIHGCIRQIE